VTEVDTAPRLTALYGRAALAAIRPGRRATALPAGELSRSDVRVDRAHLAAYDRVCGFRLRDELPPTYPHLLVFGLQLALMSAGDFPFPMIGLVHVANRISQRRPLLAGEPLVVRTRAANLRPHERGQRFDLVSEVLADGEPVWSETSTYLHRTGGGSGSRERPADAPPAPTAVWRLPADTGRRYAAVSGDRNPIHLHPVTARLFGFRGAIAHGMWSLARCLAFEEGRLPAAVDVDVRFTLPILLPATVALRTDGNGFWLRDARSGRPHLAGTIRPAWAASRPGPR
jgi:acyl dehydratase